MNAKFLKSVAKVGTVLVGTAASFILAACINTKEDEPETMIDDCDYEVTDIPDEVGEDTASEEAGS